MVSPIIYDTFNVVFNELEESLVNKPQYFKELKYQDTLVKFFNVAMSEESRNLLLAHFGTRVVKGKNNLEQEPSVEQVVTEIVKAYRSYHTKRANVSMFKDTVPTFKFIKKKLIEGIKTFDVKNEKNYDLEFPEHVFTEQEVGLGNWIGYKLRSKENLKYKSL